MIKDRIFKPGLMVTRHVAAVTAFGVAVRCRRARDALRGCAAEGYDGL